MDRRCCADARQDVRLAIYLRPDRISDRAYFLHLLFSLDMMPGGVTASRPRAAGPRVYDHVLSLSVPAPGWSQNTGPHLRHGHFAYAYLELPRLRSSQTSIWQDFGRRNAYFCALGFRFGDQPV